MKFNSVMLDSFSLVLRNSFEPSLCYEINIRRPLNLAILVIHSQFLSTSGHLNPSGGKQ